MPYTYNYPRPAVTIDCLLFCKSEEQTYLLLIQRKHPPFKGKWAFPGGFIEINETIEEAAYRELKEETGITNTTLYQFKTYGDVDRDPRGRTISVVYYGFVNPEDRTTQAGSDAKAAEWFPINNLPELAFDHDKIIHEALEEYELI
ncbi:MAG: NUDIX domain-containing protein [Bacteroidota bacterium]